MKRTEAVQAAADKAKHARQRASLAAQQAAHQAADQAGPLLDRAREEALVLLERAKDEASPRLAEARRRAELAAAAARGEKPPRRWPWLVSAISLGMALGAAVASVVRAATQQQQARDAQTQEPLVR